MELMSAVCGFLYFCSPLPAARDKVIEIRSATYGLNCSISNIGNAKTEVATKCDGKETCVFDVDDRKLGGLASGCAKNFIVRWSCGGPSQEITQIGPEASGQYFSLSCLK